MSRGIDHDDCAHVCDALSGMVDGALSPEEHARIEAHLTICPACQTEAALLRWLAGVLHQLPRPEPEDGMRARLLEQVRAEARTERECVTTISHGGRVTIHRHTGPSFRSGAVRPLSAGSRSLRGSRELFVDGTGRARMIQTTEWR